MKMSLLVITIGIDDYVCYYQYFSLCAGGGGFREGRSQRRVEPGLFFVATHHQRHTQDAAGNIYMGIGACCGTYYFTLTTYLLLTF